jgi:nucleoid-associated protein YgaU
LNRRRYRESVNALKEIIGDRRTPPLRKLRAIDTLLSIYDRHDRTEAAKEARRRTQSAPEAPGEPTAPSAAPTGEEETVDAFLARIRGSKTEELATDDE